MPPLRRFWQPTLPLLYLLFGKVAALPAETHPFPANLRREVSASGEDSLRTHFEDSIPRALLGINYGVGLAKNPLPFGQAFALLRDIGVNKLKLFDHDMATLEVISSTIPNAAVTIGFSTEEMLSLADHPSLAFEALQPLQVYDSLIQYIALASEPNESLPPSTLSRALPRALTQVNSALDNLDMRAKVTVPFTMALLHPLHTPALFLEAWNETLSLILPIFHERKAPFMMNIHPYPAYVEALAEPGSDPSAGEGIPLAYALGSAGELRNGSWLEAEYKRVREALTGWGYPSMRVVIGETGWPTAGGKAATVENACTYVNGLVSWVGLGVEEGEAGREVYVFEAFDEQLKPAEGIEPHWGLMTERGVSKFRVQWQGQGERSSL